MLIGMAAYKAGVFSAALSPSRYRQYALAGLALGLIVIACGLYKNEMDGWSYETSFFLNGQFNYWGSLFVSLAYISIVMLWCQGSRLNALRSRLASVGRMAFTNYIAQSILCTLFFYGHGLGMFGQLDRWQQLLVVLGVWVILLIVSPWWLARYRFGPLEWFWRSLTYMQLQPMKRT